MDFESLLGQHTQEQEKNQTNLVKSVNALDGALSASREGPDDGGNPYGRWGSGQRGRGRGRPSGYGYHNQKRRKFHQKPKGGVTENSLEGEFIYDTVYGEYGKWKRLWGVTPQPEPQGEGGQTEEPGIVVKFSAKGEDNIVVALSPMLGRCDDPGMYEIVIGGWKDTKSVIRRRAQGDECAVSMQPRLCSPHMFTRYWAMQHNGVVSAGVGENVGENVIVAWKDPHPILGCYASFTCWDNVCIYKDIQVSTRKDMNIDMMEDIEWTSFVPQYLQNAQEDSEKARQRAERFGIAFNQPTRGAGLIDSNEHLAPNDQHMMRLAQSHQNTRDNVATGFDLTTEEERKKQEERKKRFNIPENEAEETDADGGEQNYATREKREQRAARFNLPVVEDFNQINSISQLLSKLRAPRKDPEPDELRRPESLHVYGPFDGKYTKDILTWFEEYGASHIEWLHDCALNVLFKDEFTAKRALAGLGKAIPKNVKISVGEESTEEEKAIEAEIETLIAAGWLQGEYWGRVFLMRQATMTDVKASKDSEFRTHRSVPSRGGRHIRKTYKNISGLKRSRDEDDDVEMDEEDDERNFKR